MTAWDEWQSVSGRKYFKDAYGDETGIFKT